MRPKQQPIKDKKIFALSNSYYLSYDETPGRTDKNVEKSVIFGIDCGT